MVKRLIVSREAYLHIDRIIEFNDRRNQSDTYSRKFVKALFRQLELLKNFLVWDNFYIYYSIIDEENTIEVNSIYHQKEDIRR